MLYKLFCFVWRKWINPGDKVFKIKGWNKCLVDTELGGREFRVFLLPGMK